MDTNSSRNQAEAALRVGEFEVWPDRLVIRRGREETPVRQQTLRVLLYLIDHRDRVVSRDELHQAIWGDTAVTADALVQCIVEIRRILGDRAREPRFIRTVQKIGYSFIGPVSIAGPSAPAPVPAELSAPVPKPWRRHVGLLAAAAILVAIAAPNRLPIDAPPWSKDPGRKHLVLLPFSKASGTPSVDWLTNGLPNMLMTGVGRSIDVSALAVPDAETGRAIARRAHADGVVSGSFTEIGDTLRVDVRLEGVGGETIATDTLIAARHDAVLVEIDRLAERLIATVGGRAPAALARSSQVGDVMTRDLEAYRDYILGVERANAVEPEAALELFERAIARDPEFAMAHARIGATYAVTLGIADKAQPYLRKAFQFSDRLRERDRLWILAWYALSKVDFDGAVTPLETLIAKYPDDTESYGVLGNLYIGQERFADAIDVLNRGLAVRPDAKELLNYLSAAATLSERRETALDAARRYVAVAPNEANAYDSLGLRFQHFGQFDDALNAFEQASRVNTKFGVGYAHAGNIYFLQGRYRDAAAAFEHLRQVAASDEDRARAYSSLAWVAYRGGDDRKARALADRALTMSKRYWWPAGIFDMDRGDMKAFERVRRADVAAGVFSNRGKPFPLIAQHYEAGLDLLSAGRTERAIAELREAVKHPRMDWSINSLDDSLAETLVRLRRYDEAQAEYRRLAAEQPWMAWYHFRLGELAERGSDVALARREFQAFLSLWPKADPDVPAVKTARARVSTLASR